MTSRSEELAKSITPCPCCTGDYSGVIEALRTYGKLVRERDKEVCKSLVNGSDGDHRMLRCAAAIDAEELP